MERFIANAKQQETLEEAIDRYYDCEIDNTNIEREHFEDDIKELMIYSANQWQQERSYSEEDMKNAYCNGALGLKQFKSFNESFYIWFEQFKKK